MAEFYDRRIDAGEPPLGEDGAVTDRGLFGGHRRPEYEEPDMYAAELGGRPGGVMYPGEGAYGSRPPPGVLEPEYAMAGGYGARIPPPPEVVYGDGGGGYGGDGYGGGGYGGGGYGGGGYGGGPYARRPDVYDETSDLGTGLMDAHVRRTPDYGSSLTTPDMAGVPVGAYEERGRFGHHEHHEPRTEAEFEEERRHKRYAEAAAAAALGYGLHERHEKNNAEERLEELGYDSDGKRKNEHHLFRRSDY